MAHNTRVLGHIVAFLTVAVWGSTFVFTKLLLLSGLTAAQIFTLRFIIAYVSLMVFSLSRKRPESRMSSTIQLMGSAPLRVSPSCS